jgi:hypothetical protein
LSYYRNGANDGKSVDHLKRNEGQDGFQPKEIKAF